MKEQIISAMRRTRDLLQPTGDDLLSKIFSNKTLANFFGSESDVKMQITDSHGRPELTFHLRGSDSLVWVKSPDGQVFPSRKGSIIHEHGPHSRVIKRTIVREQTDGWSICPGKFRWPS